MKVLISWSGAKSKQAASALRKWIPDVIQTVEPWMSQTDIDAGARWNKEIVEMLSETKFGIICLTKDNLTAPWILFEAGALAKTISDTFVCPYLIGIEPANIPQGPLTQFQAKRANETETWELVSTINKALKNGALPEEKLKRAFDRWWPDLLATLNTLPTEEHSDNRQRSVDDMVSEILEVVRGITRRTSIERYSIPKPRTPITDEIVEQLKERDGDECVVCRRTPPVLHLDHISPMALGGSDTLDNLQLVCSIHNRTLIRKTVDDS